MEQRDTSNVTRDQANDLMWAQVKPWLWAALGGLALAAAAAMGFGWLALGAYKGVAIGAALATSAFAYYKEWEAETEFGLKAQRVQANIDSDEFAEAMSTIQERMAAKDKQLAEQSQVISSLKEQQGSSQHQDVGFNGMGVNGGASALTDMQEREAEPSASKAWSTKTPPKKEVAPKSIAPGAIAESVSDSQAVTR